MEENNTTVQKTDSSESRYLSLYLEKKQELDKFLDKTYTLQTFLKDNYQDIDQDILRGITEIFGLELEKTIIVHFTVDAEITLTVPLGYDSDSIDANKMGVDVQFWGDEESVDTVDIFDIDITSVDEV